jgi:Rne/Rng family ribonuclease
MSKELVITATPHETRVAIVEDGQLCEIYVEREKEFALVGSIYKGRVTRVLPGMQSAFVDIGLDGDAFLYVSDFLQDVEEYDSILTTVEEKVQKMEQQGGVVFTPATEAAPEPPEVNGGPPAAAAPPASAPERRENGGEARSGGLADRGPRGDRGFDRGGRRGGRGRGGRRWGRRGGRGRGPGRGGDLPPSKYASHRPYEPPPPAENYEPIILPGESLAKYKDRIPAPAPAEPAESAAPPAQSAESPRLPESVFAAPAAEVRAVPEEQPRSEAPAAQSPPEPSEPARTPSGWTSALWPWTRREPEPEPPAPAEPAPERALERAGEPESPAAAAAAEPAESEGRFSETAEVSGSELSVEEAAALAEHVAEAQQEEGAAEPPGDDFVGEETEAHEESPDDESGEHIDAGEENHGWTAENSQPGTEPTERRHARVEHDPRGRMQRPGRRGGHRQGRPFRQQRPRAPRRTQSISDLLKPGQEIIVQIAKEPLGKKGARITSHIALPGRFLVYMPTLDHVGVSRKIGSAEERARLRRLLGEMKSSLGYAGGFIVRTAAERATDDELRGDVEFLVNTWHELRTRSEQKKAPALLHRDLNLVERILRDHLSDDYSAIWVDNEEEFTKVVEFVNRFQPRLVNRVKLYVKEAPIFEEFGIQQEIDKALRPKVWLKSGGYIVINHTEALVAIDVNTGKFVGRGSSRLEDTIVKTNLEAVKEIVRQIRLRDLGGIIVIDFIDMEERKNRQKVMQALDDALLADKAPSKVLAFNEFGLVAITRKRTKQALERVLTQPCPYCSGSGMVKSIPTICYEIQAEARKMAAELDSQSLTLRVHPEIAKALKTRESSLIEELEQWTHRSVIIQADATLHWEQYDIY